ncbi:ABC transporter permease subunit [Zavarzinia compransoris]|uniref:ABC transporter domain-containing protein n=1 Tax=Zavarzinia compransoris TaxID=1264899 RepID=A0A317DV04_9PROT|nr:branched-chain amino acid ABC transporter ATP-binding protein/permease [Zavarzinia compransoris]PWR17810.1 hypothetical protein DKG75_21965 [Zavarzinia compransoris]TDP49343.1 amino acid/amide ABC transporter membrane protein 2 (HAAT family) /amino acid/amide ABC transporter ATP-binding protein 1 (HAAT family) [Zavarzinia compransoris]
MSYLIDVATLAAILAIATHGYMLIKGLGGLLHLGHAVFYGLGAYGAAIASVKLLPAGAFPLSLLLGALTAGVGGLLVGLPGLRDRARYFMIVTFAIQLIFVTFMINLEITGGPDGLNNIPGIALGPWQPGSKDVIALGPLQVTYPVLKLAVMIGFAALSFLLCTRLIRSPYGRLVRATREDELVVEAYGRAATPVKLGILVIGAALTGFAGALFAHHFNYVGPSQFELDATVLFLVMLIVGGQYSLLGATLGTVLMIALLEVLRYLLESVLVVPFEMTAHLRQVFFAVALLAMLSLRGGGIMPERLPRYRNARPAPAPQGDDEFAPVPVDSLPVDSAPRVVPLPNHGPETKPILSARGLAKHFGGVQAVADAGLDLYKGRIVAIIGSNGAGKTSTFNMLSGFETPDSGTITLAGHAIAGKRPAAVARLGLARTFQDVRMWKGLTVIENILAAGLDQPGTHPLALLFRGGRARAAERANVERAWALLERFGLQHHANLRADQISYAQRKMLSLARITAFDPEVMLLDEPTSGVDPRRLSIFLDHIRAFAKVDNRAVCLIEHNMTVVRELADWVIFMDEGRTVAAGPPEEILGDHGLMRTYLGHREKKRA